MKSIIWTFTFCILALISFVAYLVFGAAQEGWRAEQRHFFEELGQIAFVDSRNLDLSFPLYNRTVLPLPHGTMQNIETMGCSTDLSLQDVDSRNFYSVYTLFRREPFLVIYIYSGEVVNFQKYFSSQKIPVELKSIPKFTESDNDLRINRSLLRDLTDDYSNYILGTNFNISSTECANFSFTEITQGN